MLLNLVLYFFWRKLHYIKFLHIPNNKVIETSQAHKALTVGFILLLEKTDKLPLRCMREQENLEVPFEVVLSCITSLS